MKIKHLAVAAGVLSLAVVPATALGGTSPTKQYPPKECKQNKKKCKEDVLQGRMTGHGHLTTAEYGRVQWEFRNSICNANRFPDLKVAWGGNRFILTSYSVPLRCVDRPGFDEGQPDAGFDTIIGQGTGRLNGQAATATFSFTDAGEPGRNDRATITITDADGDVVLDLDDVRASGGGNHQAHRR